MRLYPLLVVGLIKINARLALALLGPAGGITLLARVLGHVDGLAVLVQGLVGGGGDLGGLEQLPAWC